MEQATGNSGLLVNSSCQTGLLSALAFIVDIYHRRCLDNWHLNTNLFPISVFWPEYSLLPFFVVSEIGDFSRYLPIIETETDRKASKNILPPSLIIKSTG